MKAQPSHTDSIRRRTSWVCAADPASIEPPPRNPAWTLWLPLVLGFSAGFILVFALAHLGPKTEASAVIRYSLPLDLFQDSPEVQCGDGKRVLNGHCVCSASCDSLQEAEI